jgi:DNA-binding transcriptional ArsR family regulator
MNMLQPVQNTHVNSVAGILQAIDQPARLEILLVIGSGEVCVCHLEAALGQRQAYISQHLMALRDAGVITSRRDGRYVFYRLVDVRVLDLIGLAGRLAGIPSAASNTSQLVQDCPCPHCSTAGGDQRAGCSSPPGEIRLQGS